MQTDARKQDTRRKIELGGLVIKSGLGQEPNAVMLGAMTLAARALAGPHSAAVRARFQSAGDSLFKDIHEPK
ncbi:conjugal transfer protein TraD [Pseudoxanthomonas sp. CAU 1598]|uniref:Conjugal transfer protein TraD n=2 Tax=Pseudomarimonas arenosa TaxID=2774145 RepID=A0AAW3ZPG7_9GAMM|nr:conjugal transfer protein TraD [Pseudomarimonas arenosa]MBD8526226.1 conjugal transfer protein TraD [Pseudomarimonas arenosa]